MEKTIAHSPRNEDFDKREGPSIWAFVLLRNGSSCL